MRVILDGTPLLGPRTGVGHYTGHLLAELPLLPGLDVAATAFTWRGLEGFAPALPPGVRPAARRIPARLMHEAWARTEVPKLEWLTGAVDVVHGTNFVLPPPRRARGVLTIHDLAYLKLTGTVSTASARYRELVPRGLRRAAAVVTPSAAIAAEVVDTYRLDPAMVTVTPLGVDTAWFDASPPSARWLAAHGLPERYLLFVGTLEPRKNLPTLLEAVRGLHAEVADAPPLLLVGPSGWGPAPDLSRLPAGAVVTVGYLVTNQLRSLVAGASALCFPSFYEGFGLPPLEALAAGTQVVASDIPAVREVVGPLAGKSVRLVPPMDADAFTDALIGVLKEEVDPAPGRSHARTFTWRRTAEHTAAVYASVTRSDP
ncbi:glycosyltransferase family 4 protein [Candidatus Protofrankia californiensis]|uniref:glycosyltransferase family 4 protein n=1 Tax=Candidatus Protofrankia californiensis TaxID=1839754 RepID=UPI00104108BC|nr:glycosyltransferase family 1 protein [Candidatus Protofrankia californiensis]